MQVLRFEARECKHYRIFGAAYSNQSYDYQKMKYLPLILACCLFSPIYGQTKLPIIKARSTNVAINDGGFLDKNAWVLSPEAKPDVYTANRSTKPKWVTFYTDIDSIRVKVKPGTKFNFIILLNEKDTCYTQIVSSKSVGGMTRPGENTHDTIPFTLTPYNAIQVEAIINHSDTLNLHFDLGSLDFRLTKVAILEKTKLLSNQPDALVGKTQPDFNKLAKISSLQIGNLVWDNPNVQAANNAAHEMDGRFGWRVFDGKVVEIDYDKNQLIVHSKFAGRKKGYEKSAIKFIQSLFCIEATIQIDNKNYSGDFLFDTGSNLAMILDSTWMSVQNFPENLKILKRSSLSDGAGRKYETTIVVVPSLSVSGFVLNNITTSKLGFKSPVGFQMNYFGNDLLKRFNVIIDLKNDNIYLKPNSLFAAPYLNQ